MKILVIGSGPSGLVTAKVLLESDPLHEVVVVESSFGVGGAFATRGNSGSLLER